LVFEKNANFLPKIGKIAENCDHNIDPWSPCMCANFVIEYLKLQTLTRKTFGPAGNRWLAKGVGQRREAPERPPRTGVDSMDCLQP
jgi:hypothetical protein